MLNRSKFLKDLSAASQKLFVDFSDEYDQVCVWWQRAADDPLLLQKIRVHESYELPTWRGKLNTEQQIDKTSFDYQVIAIDGSQIYPDKHQGTHCFLINIGTAVFCYEGAVGSTFFSSEPYLFADYVDDVSLKMTVDLVNGRREELEFQTGLALVKSLKNKVSTVLLCDGSLIFWHLESHDVALKHYFLRSYLALFEELYQQNIPVVSYMSLPKNKDLVNLIRAQATEFLGTAVDRSSLFKHTVDSVLVSLLFPVGSCTTLFKSNTAITKEYPEHLSPWFCYYVAQDEVVRIEFPQYSALDDHLFNQGMRVIVDQIKKGHGYPVSLAEAHMQAVVRGSDRDFFYHALGKYSSDHKRSLKMSQKNLKKRRMAI